MWIDMLPDSPYILTYNNVVDDNIIRIWDKKTLQCLASYSPDFRVGSRRGPGCYKRGGYWVCATLPRTESLTHTEAVPASGRVRNLLVCGHVNTEVCAINPKQRGAARLIRA